MTSAKVTPAVLRAIRTGGRVAARFSPAGIEALFALRMAKGWPRPAPPLARIRRAGNLVEVSPILKRSQS